MTLGSHLPLTQLVFFVIKLKVECVGSSSSLKQQDLNFILCFVLIDLLYALLHSYNTYVISSMTYDLQLESESEDFLPERRPRPALPALLPGEITYGKLVEVFMSPSAHASRQSTSTSSSSDFIILRPPSQYSKINMLKKKQVTKLWFSRFKQRSINRPFNQNIKFLSNSVWFVCNSFVKICLVCKLTCFVILFQVTQFSSMVLGMCSTLKVSIG